MSKSRVAERSAAYALKTAAEPAFGASFDLLATAPQGVAKLRELILLLAVQGKLVAQDSSDESAGEFLERVRKEKARLLTCGAIKPEKSTLPISEEEVSFELPQ